MNTGSFTLGDSFSGGVKALGSFFSVMSESRNWIYN